MANDRTRPRKRRSAEVVADNVYFGDSKRDSQGQEGGYQQGGFGGQNYGGSQTFSQGYGAPAPQPAAPAPGQFGSAWGNCSAARRA